MQPIEEDSVTPAFARAGMLDKLAAARAKTDHPDGSTIALILDVLVFMLSPPALPAPPPESPPDGK